MNIENIFTADELALIDSGSYTPGRAVLDAKLDLACAMEREACAQVAEDSDHVVSGRGYYDQLGDADATARNIAIAIRARGQA